MLPFRMSACTGSLAILEQTRRKHLKKIANSRKASVGREITRLSLMDHPLLRDAKTVTMRVLEGRLRRQEARLHHLSSELRVVESLMGLDTALQLSHHLFSTQRRLLQLECRETLAAVCLEDTINELL